MENLTKVKVVARYFTTPKQGIEIVTDALNAGWKHRDGQTLKEIKKDIKSIMKANDSELIKYEFGVEEDSDNMVFSIFAEIKKK
jgi:hypothetical protein